MPGNVVSRYLVSWTDPYFLDSDYSLGLSGFYFQRFYPDWDEERAGGRVNVGRNPFSDEPLVHSFGISTMVALLKVEAGARTGFAFLKAGLFNLEYWRGNTNQGRYSLKVPMIGTDEKSLPSTAGRKDRVGACR